MWQNQRMLLRKSLVIVLSLGLFGACSSAESTRGANGASSGMSREESQNKWATKVGQLRANVGIQNDSLWADEQAKDGYWLTPELFSLTLMNNRYYSKVKKGTTQERYSRNFCGDVSYDKLIASHIGKQDGYGTAKSFGMFMDGPSTGLGKDAIWVSMQMTVFEFGDDIVWSDVGPNLFRDMQDQIASQASGRCQFTMRQQFREGTNYPKQQSDSTLVSGWWTEGDLLCPKQPCVGATKHKFDSQLSDYNTTATGETSYFFLVQANLTGRPFMRTVFFQPRPEEGALLLLEVSSIRNGFVERRMSGDLVEQHAKTVKDLFLAWESRSAQYSNLEEMGLLYRNSQPLTEELALQVKSAETECVDILTVFPEDSCKS
jgi:hypothetical protein